MNSYNACLSPPPEKQIRMNEVKQKINQHCQNIPKDYKKCLEESIEQAEDDKQLDKRLNYIPKIVNIIREKPRKYLINFGDYFDECNQILKA